MTKLNILSALAAFAIAGSPAGCSLGDVSGPTVGDGDGDGDGDNGDDDETDEGAEIFENDVKPLVATCAGEACHSGTFAQPLKFLGTGSPDEYYSSIISFASVTGNFDPALANLLLMVKDPAHQASAPIAVPWSAEQEDLIANWLLFERDARQLEPDDEIDPEPDPGAAPTSTRQAFAQWAGCMSRENWDLANMGNWANKGSDEGPCRGCHNQGAYRFFANGENARMFDMNRTELYILSFFKAAVDDEGAVSVVPAVSKFERMSLGTPITNHPEFNSSPDNNQMESLQQFYELTLADLEAGNCGPAEFYVP